MASSTVTRAESEAGLMTGSLFSRERGFLRVREIQGGFVRLPAPEFLSLCVAKEKGTKEKGHPGWRLPSIHGRQVREAGPGFSSGLLPARKGEAIPGLARCAALSSPPHRRPGAPEKQARIVRARS
jgi:hypothetical protein